MAQHPDLPSQGFPMSTIFTLGTDNGIVLLRVHTTYTYSPPLLEGTTSLSDYTGPTGNHYKKKLSSITMELMSQLTAKN